MRFLRDCKLFDADMLLVVPDPCDDVGSAGSALNALLCTHLCARQGLSVLNESLLLSSKILIILLGATKEAMPLGAGFMPTLEIVEIPWILPDYPIVHTVRNVNELATNCGAGVWICGTDALWKVDQQLQFHPKNDEIAAFCFKGQPDEATTHGVYVLDEDNIVRSLNYRNPNHGDAASVVLALLYLPPAISTIFLSLHSVYPICRSTYYGIDSGTCGLKLSLFFDLVLATCSSENAFVWNRLATDKSDTNFKLLQQARNEIWRRFQLRRCRAYYLQLTHYEYLGEIRTPNCRSTRLELMKNLQLAILSRVKIWAMGARVEYTTALLKTLIAISKYYDVELDVLHELESLCASTTDHRARLLMMAAEYLALRARGRGGIRSGPAANPVFARILRLIKKDPEKDHFRELFRLVKEKWMRTETEMIRAARHFEAAAQIYTQLLMEAFCSKHFSPLPRSPQGPKPSNVTVQAAARVDLFGGWLDTPPITLQAHPSAVVNMAVLVDGNVPLYSKPIACHVRHCATGGITVRNGNEAVHLTTSQSIVELCDKPGNPGALMCACLVCMNIPASTNDDLYETLEAMFSTVGLEIECVSLLPQGSGLGTSSILAASIIQALGLACGCIYSKKSVCHAVLMVEQILTTGGGWQDQVGCLYPGIKKGYLSDVDNSVEVEKVIVSNDFENEINRRMVLVYTGRTRLAKNLLQEVIRGWYAGGPVRDAVMSLAYNVEKFAEALRAGTMPCELIKLYYNVKKSLASGCEPEHVAHLISALENENLIETAWLAGAGGGGFLYLWLKDGITSEDIRSFASVHKLADISVHNITVDYSSIQATSN